MRFMLSALLVSAGFLATPFAARACGAGLVCAPAVPQPASTADLVGALIQNTGPAATNVAVSYGQVFQPGQLRPSAAVGVAIGGVVVPSQLDVKTVNPDGSVRFGVVSLIVPSLAAGQSLPVMLTLAQPPVSPTKPGLWTAARTPFTLAFTLHDTGATQTVDVSAMLQAALHAGGANFWLRGSVAREVRVQLPVTSSLRVVVDARAYANGDASFDVQFNNDIAMQAQGGVVSYDVTGTLAGHKVLSQKNLTQYQYQTWHQVIWLNGSAPQVNVVHDLPAMARAGAIQNYDWTTGVDPGVISTFTTMLATGPQGGYGPLGNAGVLTRMGTTGDRPDIGPLTAAQTVWAITQDPTAAAYVLAQADFAAGAVPWHFYDPTAGSYLTITSYPNIWTDYRCGVGTITCVTPAPDWVAGSNGSGWTPDTAHVPTLSYFPYLMTGSRYYLDQLSAQGAADIITSWPGFRQVNWIDMGVVTNIGTQTRASAWALRDVVHAAFASPNYGTSASPMAGYFNQIQANNMTYLVSLIGGTGTLATEGNSAGFFPELAAPSQVPTWQHDYLVSSIVLAAKQGDKTASRTILPWMVNFEAGRFLNAANGLNPYSGVQYYMPVSDSTGQTFLSKWAAIQAASYTYGNAGLTNDWNQTIGHDYIQDACMALAGIIDVTGSADASAAYAWLQTSNHTYCAPANFPFDPRRNIVPIH